MSDGQFGAIVLGIPRDTVALVWWAAALTTTVKHHDQRLLDHEDRLREAKL